MTSRFARLCLVIASSAFALGAFAQNQPAQPPPTPLPTVPPAPAPAQNPAAPAATQPGTLAPTPGDEEVTLVLPDADLDTILSALEIYTGKVILRPQQLTTTTYNLKIKKPIPKSEAIRYIETILGLNGIGLAPFGDKALKVLNLNMVKTEAPEMIDGSTLSYPPSGRAATKLFQLEFARAQEIQGVIQTVLNPFYGGPVSLPNANALLITDSISNLQRVERLVEQLDRPISAGMNPKFYPLTNGAKASDVINKLRGILGTGALQQQIGTGTSYSADDRTNQIILVSDPRLHPLFDDLIAKLDQRADPLTRNEVIYLKNAKAKDVVDVIGRIIQGQSTAAQRSGSSSVRPGTLPNQPTPPGTPPQPAGPALPAIASATNANEGANEFSGIMTVVSDERANAVVVSGTPDDIRLVKSLIDKLDIVLRQVRIEVVIAEVTLDDNNQSGISSLGLVLEGDKLVGFSGAYPGFDVTDGTITRPGGTAIVSGPWDLATTIAIKTTPRKRNNWINTVPTVTTSHGKKAIFFSGETRPVVTGTIQSAVGSTSGLASSSTVTQQQIGTTLTVTPFIGSDDSVQLEMEQRVEDVTGRVQVDNNEQYIIGRRESTNYVTAKSGDIIVIGGFRKNSSINETNRLGPIPILGDIFGSRTRSKNRNELVIFVRPTVLTNNPTVDNAEALKRVQEFPSRDQVRGALDPNYVAPKESVLDKILPR